MKKESRTYVDKYGVETTITDCYSNARNDFDASKCVLGKNITRQEYEWELEHKHLLIMDGGTNGKYYVAYRDNGRF